LIRGAPFFSLSSIKVSPPLLEAMLLGTPVLTSNAASLPEVSGVDHAAHESRARSFGPLEARSELPTRSEAVFQGIMVDFSSKDYKTCGY